MLKFKISLLAVFFLVMGCVTVKPGKEMPKKIEGHAGRTLSFYSLSIDADYDPRLDDVVPHYKLLSILVKNVSLRPIPMDYKNDRWEIIADNGKKYRAVHSLKLKSPKSWRELPERIRNMIGYPEIVPINYSVTFDILFPPKVDLDYIKEIHYYNASWDKEFLIEKDY